MEISIPISVGELLDKISILMIKSLHTKSSYVKKELNDLITLAKKNKVYEEKNIQDLLEINSKLWVVEDELRIHEKNRTFNYKFILLARSVYILNDRRSEIKKQISQNYNSTYIEIKCYA